MKTIRTLSILAGMLCIQLSAFAAHWSCDASAYRYDMLAYVSLTVNGAAVTDFSDYEVAAFCGSDCRGVVSFSSKDTYTYGTIRIRSNNTNGETITFKLFKVSADKELAMTQTMDFVSDSRQGLPSSPVSLTYNFVTGISLTPQTVVLLPEGTAQFSAGITPSDANLKDVAWTTDDASVITVSNSGLVTAQGGGDASVICSATDGSGTTDKALVHVHSLQAVAAKSPTCTATGNLAYWYCPLCEKYFSDPTASTETSLDAVTIPATGHAYSLTAWNWAEDGKSASATFTCTNDPAHAETLEASVKSAVKTPASCTEMGTTTYTASVTFQDTTYTDTRNVVDIEALGHDYVYTDNGDGTHTVSCRHDDLEPYSEEHQCENGICIHCHACPVTAIVISSDSASLTVGDSITLTVTITPDSATNRQVEWASSDEMVATVADGTVIAVGEGIAVISVTACDGTGVTAECTITVAVVSSLQTVIRSEDAPAHTLQGLPATSRTTGIIIVNGKKYLKIRTVQ